MNDVVGRLLAALERSGSLDLESLIRECGMSEEEVVETLDALEGLDLVVRC